MTVDSQVNVILDARKLRSHDPWSSVKQNPRIHTPDVLIVFDLSFFMRQISFCSPRGDGPRTWRLYISRLEDCIRRIVTKGEGHVVLVCDDRPNYPALRKEGSVVSRGEKRQQNAYPDIEPYVLDEDNVLDFDLSKVLDHKAGFELAVKKVVQLLRSDVIMIDKRDRPPIRINNGTAPSYLSMDEPVCNLWSHTWKDANFSECDTLGLYLLQLHRVAYPDDGRFMICMDGDYVIGSALHNDAGVDIVWPNGDKGCITFDMKGICRLYGRPPGTDHIDKDLFDVQLAMSRAFLVYLAKNDFTISRYYGISPPAIITLALENVDIPPWITYSDNTISFDTKMLNTWMCVKRTSSIEYRNSVPVSSTTNLSPAMTKYAEIISGPQRFHPYDASPAAPLPQGRGRGGGRGGRGGGPGSDGSKPAKVQPLTSKSRPSPAYAKPDEQLTNINVMTCSMCFVLYLMFFDNFTIPQQHSVFAKVGLL